MRIATVSPPSYPAFDKGGLPSALRFVVAAEIAHEPQKPAITPKEPGPLSAGTDSDSRSNGPTPPVHLAVAPSTAARSRSNSSLGERTPVEEQRRTGYHPSQNQNQHDPGRSNSNVDHTAITVSHHSPSFSLIPFL